jgi:UDP-N-acetylglucosamine diphosphorylase / glucose-1-phosphate thymidylyltransferase / UDP-N-acetylgalactosamine diphosphorylase / glucosamine-1-phosphate N-acetyltransferase / galactosamine-1-phosphate N-acetyltransferase
VSVRVGDFIASVAQSALAPLAGATPWSMTQDAEQIVSEIIDACGVDFSMRDGVAVHRTARIETGASLKGPAFIGPNCFVASTALIRGGCWLERDVIIGPSAELKTSFVFAGSKLAHLNFVGDSVLGADVNVEAGAMIANYRNERTDKRIRIAGANGVIDTGVEKFGALIGDGTRIGANAVIAPGALLTPRTIVARLSLVDQSGEG